MGGVARDQSLVFLCMAYAGFGLGVCYDLLAPLRRSRLTPVADLLFFAAAAGALGVGLILLEQSAPRSYILLGAAFGGALYALGVRALVRRLGKRLRARFARRRKRINDQKSKKVKQENR